MESSFLYHPLNRRTVHEKTNFSCRYHSVTDRRCPIFSIGYILQNLRDRHNRIDLTALHLQASIEIFETQFQTAHSSLPTLTVAAFVDSAHYERVVHNFIDSADDTQKKVISWFYFIAA